jgi:uncharacterized protein (TIGR02646 family)
MQRWKLRRIPFLAIYKLTAVERIEKLPESPGLLRYKMAVRENTNPDIYPGTYDDFKGFENKAAFDELREQLIKENKYVCAYCGQAIRSAFSQHKSPMMKVEHFLPQSKYPKFELEYTNLLGCCLGNQTEPDKKAENHCDSKKKEEELKAIKNPAVDTAWNQWIIYISFPQVEEVVLAVDENCPFRDDLDSDVNKTLHLNERNLKRKRFQAIKNYVEKRLGDKASTEEFSDLLNQYRAHPTHHPPFPHLIYWELQRRIAKAQG